VLIFILSDKNPLKYITTSVFCNVKKQHHLDDKRCCFQ